LQQQAQNNSLAQFSAGPDLHNEFLSAVIGAMDTSADLSAQILYNPDLPQKLLDELVPVHLQGIEGDSVNAPGRGLRFGCLTPSKGLREAFCGASTLAWHQRQEALTRGDHRP
jgi:hypothetical protein